MTNSNLEVSSWTNFPTPEDPKAKYKFVSLHFFIDRNLLNINRETYGLLDWISDCGGLLDALLGFGKIIMLPYSSYALQSTMATLLVLFRPSMKENNLGVINS